MGFEVDNSRRDDQDLWDIKKEPATRPVKDGPRPSVKQPIRTAPVQRTGAIQTKAPGQTEVKVAFAAKQTTLIVMAVVAICMAIAIVTFSGRQRQRESESKPIALTTRLSYLGETVPLPTGMEYDAYDWTDPELYIYVKGDVETAEIDYLSSRIFAMRFIEEADKVIFVEEDTGKQYEFQR